MAALTRPSSTATSLLKIRQAARVIEAGGIVAYPTEAVYGLGCDPANSGAVLEILRLKRRPTAAGLILIAAELHQLEGWIAPSAEELRHLMDDAHTASGITWVIRSGPMTPEWITGGRPTTAVRITHHPIAATLCREAGMPIVSTSANHSGAKPARSARAVRWAFGTDIDFILPGGVGPRQRPSEIRDARTGAVLRAG